MYMSLFSYMHVYVSQTVSGIGEPEESMRIPST